MDHGTGIWPDLRFLIPFSWGTAPLFFLAPSYTTASLKLASDVPSHDSSESKPETHKHIIITYKSQLKNYNALETKIKSSYKQIYASQNDTKKYKREFNIFLTWSIK